MFYMVFMCCIARGRAILSNEGGVVPPLVLNIWQFILRHHIFS